MRVRYTPRALSDLVEILNYIDERSPRRAHNVKRAIQKTIQLIGDFPESGPLAGIENARVLRAGRYPYLVYWSVEGRKAWLFIFAMLLAAVGKACKQYRR